MPPTAARRRLASVAFGGLILGCTILYALIQLVPEARELLDKRYIFFPGKELDGTPGDWGVGYEDVHFPASDGVKLHGWYVPGDNDVTWVWFHGNGGNISHRVEDLLLLNQHLGVNIFLFDYRGYGLSEGDVSEEGTYRDARGALDYALSREDVNRDKIVYFGRSLGSAVAVWLATQHPPAGLILESPFASVRSMARAAFHNLPIHLFLPNKYDSLSRIRDISCPLLILHGDRDEKVPIGQGRKLYEKANGPKKFYVIKGAAHDDTYIVGGDPYFNALGQFIASLGGKRSNEEA